MIPFNRPCHLASEREFFTDLFSERPSFLGDQYYTNLCTNILSQWTGSKSILVNSATAALEMMALLLDLQPGDEVIVPSFTFVSTANAFVLRGARVVLADCDETGNINLDQVEQLIGPNTKAVCVVNYGGTSCDLERAQEICKTHGLILLEDAAQSLGGMFKGKPLGSFGALACYSFHYTKNLTCGEGGALIVNDPTFFEQAHVIKDKGTNRRSYSLGEVSKYTWISKGSSYVLSELNAAHLYFQLQNLSKITQGRRLILNYYQRKIRNQFENTNVKWLETDQRNEGNGHIVGLVFSDPAELIKFQKYLGEWGIETATHYTPLHSSPFATSQPQYVKKIGPFPGTEKISLGLLRLPIYYNMELQELDFIIEKVSTYLADSKSKNAPHSKPQLVMVSQI